MLTVHHLETSRSHRILWLLEELEIPYEIKIYKRNSKTRLAPPELRAIHPLGKSPVIVDDGVAIAESGAIIEYIVERYGRNKGGALAHLIPSPGTREHLQCRYWMHYAEGTLMLQLIVALVFRMMPNYMPWPFRPLARKMNAKLNQIYLGPNIKNNFEMIETHLATHPYFAGEHLSMADFQMCYSLEVLPLDVYGFQEKTPHIIAYREKLRTRPAWIRAVEKGGPITMSV